MTIGKYVNSFKFDFNLLGFTVQFDDGWLSGKAAVLKTDVS